MTVYSTILALLIASFTGLAAGCIAFLARPKMDDPQSDERNIGGV